MSKIPTPRERDRILINQLAALLGMALGPNGIKNRSRIEAAANELLIGGFVGSHTALKVKLKENDR